jgi:flagellar basal body-associated protein FliL
MAKLDALKEKISQTKTNVSEKIDKIALFKRWKEERAQKKAKAPTDLSLQAIYRRGGTGTRLQVALFYLLAAATVASTGLAGKKIFARLGASRENEKLKAEYSHGLEEMASRVVEKANLVSMGKFTANAYRPGQKGELMAADIWLRMSDPEAAAFAEKNEDIIYDGIVSGLSLGYEGKADPLTPEGAGTLKRLIMEKLNEKIREGKVEEVFFQNLVVQ